MDKWEKEMIERNRKNALDIEQNNNEILKIPDYLTDKEKNNINQFLIVLDLKKFNLLPKVIKTRLLLYTINKVIGDVQGIGKIHIEDMLKLCQNNIGNKYLTPNKRVKIFVKKGKIFFISKTNLP